VTQQQKADLRAVGFSDEQIDVLTSADAEEIIAATNVVVTNTREVREFIATITAQARAATKEIKDPGILQLIQAHPLDDYDDVVIYRYELNDPNLIECMTKDAVVMSGAGHNCYIEGRTVRRSLRGNARGKKEDTIAVFALVTDSDADKGKAWLPTARVSLDVKTSPGNDHFWFFFERAIDWKTADRLGEGLRKATGGDHDTGVITQPFRVAGTVNYPSKKKQARGRTEIVPTSVRGFDPETLYTPESFEQEFPPSPDPKINGGGPTNGAATGTASTIDEATIAADTLRIIREGVEDDEDRSYVFYNVVMALKADGWTAPGIFTLLDRYPKGIASKYRGRLQREVERTWEKLARGRSSQAGQQPQPGTPPPGSGPPPGAGSQPGTPAPGSGPPQQPPPPPPGAQPGAGPAASGPQPATTALEDTLKIFREWLLLDNDIPVLAMLGTVAANMLSGDAIWPGLIAPPSSAKTEMLITLAKIPHTEMVGTLSVAGLLSGTPRRQRTAGARGGLLHKIGAFGFLVLKDFGSILSLRPDTKLELLAALREIYDGRWSRVIGADGGRVLEWSGKIGLLFGCTRIFDSYYGVISELGDRFLLIRLEPNEKQFLHAIKYANRAAQMRARLVEAVTDLFAVPLPAPRDISDREINWLNDILQIAVRLRGAVKRDYRTRELEDVYGAEGRARFGKALERVLSGLDCLGVKRSKARKVIRTIAFDSVPPNRLRAYRHLKKISPAWADTSTVAKAIELPTITTRRVLEELVAYGLTERTAQGQGKADLWRTV
jgi:hypothetical protein